LISIDSPEAHQVAHRIPRRGESRFCAEPLPEIDVEGLVVLVEPDFANHYHTGR
jgi:hypothetical protein